MKRLFVLFLAFMSLAFIGCSNGNDDGDVPNNSSKIVGVWFETAYWDDGAYSGRPNTWHQWNGYGYVHEFRADKQYKFYWSVSDYREGKSVADLSGTYKYDGEYLTISGGIKQKVTISENGQAMEWEQVARCTKGN